MMLVGSFFSLSCRAILPPPLFLLPRSPTNLVFTTHELNLFDPVRVGAQRREGEPSPMRPGRRRAARLLLLLLLLLLAAQTCEPRARKARKARGSRRAGGAEQEQAAEPGDVYAARLVDAAF